MCSVCGVLRTSPSPSCASRCRVSSIRRLQRWRAVSYDIHLTFTWNHQVVHWCFPTQLQTRKVRKANWKCHKNSWNAGARQPKLSELKQTRAPHSSTIFKQKTFWPAPVTPWCPIQFCDEQFYGQSDPRKSWCRRTPEFLDNPGNQAALEAVWDVTSRMTSCDKKAGCKGVLISTRVSFFNATMPTWSSERLRLDECHSKRVTES